MRLSGGGLSFICAHATLADVSIQVRCDRARRPDDRFVWQDLRRSAILMAMTSSVRNTVTAKPRVRKSTVKKARGVKAFIAERAAPRILAAPKGVRTLSHTVIKQAIEKVFAGR
jgi:hypothetical protein